ncbi:MAG: DnaK suppressor protein [bacterium]|jgi:DnaK suppressor protein|nr:DnaK suppressor protein [Solirubrobacteraceae bacterium]
MDEARARELLARAKARIERQLAELESDHVGDELADYDQHPADVGTEVFEEERDRGLAVSLREELAAIERAEKRLAEGTYGRSIESGAPIPDARLELIPWAERTAEEEERLERSPPFVPGE